MNVVLTTINVDGTTTSSHPMKPGLWRHCVLSNLNKGGIEHKEAYNKVTW